MLQKNISKKSVNKYSNHLNSYLNIVNLNKFLKQLIMLDKLLKENIYLYILYSIKK